MADSILDVDVAARTVSVHGAPEPPSIKERLTDAAEIGELLFKFALVVGFASVFSYLASNSFFPAGMTLADTFLFLEASFAFAIGYTVFACIGFLCARLLCLHFMFEEGWRRFVGFCVLAVLAALIFWLDVQHADRGKMLGGLLLTGLALQLAISLFDTPRANAPKPPVVVAMIGVSLFASLVPLYMINVNYAMPKIGLRTVNATLRLSEENYKILSSAVGGQELAALGCDAVPGSSEKLVHGVTVLWHGIGERTLVGIPSLLGDTGDTDQALKVELQREGVFLMKNYKGVRERCVDLSGELLFKSASATLDSEHEEELDRLVKFITKAHDTILEIQVTGHSDPIAYGKNAELNNDLALKRAKAISERIAEKTCMVLPKMKIDAKGAREPKSLCKDWPVKKTLGECLAVNRRVEVRMKFRE